VETQSKDFSVCVLIFEEYNLPANLKILIAWIAGRIATRHMEPNSVFSNTVLEGRVALITGGGSGIGLEIATQFGKHGAKVAIMGRRQQVLDAAVSYLESHGVEVLFFIFRETSFLKELGDARLLVVLIVLFEDSKDRLKPRVKREHGIDHPGHVDCPGYRIERGCTEEG
jgi:hypothetical protein